MQHLPNTLRNRIVAAALVRKGGVIAFPTDTLYGLAASAYNHDSVARIFTIKGRPAAHGLPVLIGNIAQIEQIAKDISSDALALAQRFWPGPLTLVLRRRSDLPAELSGGMETVAVRQPNHPAAIQLIEFSGGPITGTSANVSGGPQPISAEEVIRQVGYLVDAVLDDGPCAVGEPSTIVDTTVIPFRLIRMGAIALRQLRTVCTVDDIGTSAPVK